VTEPEPVTLMVARLRSRGDRSANKRRSPEQAAATGRRGQRARAAKVETGFLFLNMNMPFRMWVRVAEVRCYFSKLIL